MGASRRTAVLGLITVVGLVVAIGPRMCSLETREQARQRRNQEEFERQQERALQRHWQDRKALDEETERARREIFGNR